MSLSTLTTTNIVVGEEWSQRRQAHTIDLHGEQNGVDDNWQR